MVKENLQILSSWLKEIMAYLLEVSPFEKLEVKKSKWMYMELNHFWSAFTIYQIIDIKQCNIKHYINIIYQIFYRNESKSTKRILSKLEEPTVSTSAKDLNQKGLKHYYGICVLRRNLHI